MESTDSGTGEFSVGSIVWVRRRNGSWWPGKIVGPEELSASHLTSPRSGTPVKLLGREDASVDWYNLEKSKRVKAFRCGEFDDCIERAESSQGMPIKKREKYARREDAILHALDLEKQQMRKQKLSAVASGGSNKKSASFGVNKGFANTSETLRNNSVKLATAKSNQISKKLEVSPKNEILNSPVTSQKLKQGNQLSGDEDHSDVVPRMRGLQDFGLKIVPSKATLSSYVASNGLRRPTVEYSVGNLPSGGSKIGSSSKMNGKNSSHKRKRLHEDSVRRRETRRPLVQVLQSSVKSEEATDSVQIDSSIMSTSISGGLESVGGNCKAKRSKCMYFPADSNESLDYKAVSQSDIEMTDSQNETDTSETDLSGSETDSSETEEDEEMAALSDVVPTESDSYMGRHEARQHGIMSRDDTNDSMLSSDLSHFYTRYPSSAHEAVSKWQLKGKRNLRSLTKRSVDANTLDYGAYPEEKDFRGETIEMDKRYFSSRSSFKSRSLVEWDDWSSEDRRAQYSGRSRSILIDVDIKVQASYQRDRVSLVSLMSKLNGHAIVGHPVQVEALEDGSSCDLIPARDDFGNEAIENYGNAPLPHAWRTARRTANVRVPRPQPSSYHDGDEATAYGFPKSNFGNFWSFGKGTLVRKTALHGPDRKYRKSPKKIGASSSSQKTRTLSSIAIEHKIGKKRIHSTSHSQIDGLVKRESVGPTTVACIPVKLVFSRLLEKINRPESNVGLHCTL